MPKASYVLIDHGAEDRIIVIGKKRSMIDLCASERVHMDGTQHVLTALYHSPLRSRARLPNVVLSLAGKGYCRVHPTFSSYM